MGIAGPTSEYDWQYYTSNQTGLGDRPVFWPRGKVLGGSSAVNGRIPLHDVQARDLTDGRSLQVYT